MLSGQAGDEKRNPFCLLVCINIPYPHKVFLLVELDVIPNDKTVVEAPCGTQINLC